MKRLNLLFLLALLFAVGGAKADSYSFNASDWAYTGDGGRIAQGNISVSDNVITVKNVPNKGDGKNACLKFGGASSYTFDHSAVALVIKGTNLSTDVSKQALWWINNRNNGSTLIPVSATEEGGIVTLTWSFLNIGNYLRANILNNWTLSNAGTSTLFGLTPANFGNDVTITDIEWQCASAYVYNADDWAYTGDGGRIPQGNISASNNVITMTGVSANNNACLKFGGPSSYPFDHSAVALVIKGTNLSTDVTKQALWWINNRNNSSTLNPVSATKEGDIVTLTWSLVNIDHNLRLNILNSWTLNNEGGSTLFGLTPAVFGNDVTITDIEWQCVSDAYVYNASDWAHTGDPGRIADDKISVSGNVITLADVSGVNDAALVFNGAHEYLFPRSLATITITGTNLSSQAGQHAFWWLNGANNAGSINATSVSESDGKQTLTWDLTAIEASMRPTIVGEWEMRTRSAYLDWQFSTVFGLTPAVFGNNVTITNIELTMVDDANVVTRTMPSGRFGTICLPKQALPSGAEVYSVSSISDGNLSLETVDGYMTAGVPYLFKATQDNPTFTMSGDAVDVPVEVTGLVGTFVSISAPKGDAYYVLSNNKLYNVDAAANVTVGANRAYIDLNAVPTTSEARGSVFLTLEGYDPTGIGEIRTDNTPIDNPDSDVIYDLYGRRVSHPRRGIYVVNGKKILFK